MLSIYVLFDTDKQMFSICTFHYKCLKCILFRITSSSSFRLSVLEQTLVGRNNEIWGFLVFLNLFCLEMNSVQVFLFPVWLCGCLVKTSSPSNTSRGFLIFLPNVSQLIFFIFFSLCEASQPWWTTFWSQEVLTRQQGWFLFLAW